MQKDDLKPGVTVRGPILPESVQVLVSSPVGRGVKLAGKGLKSGKVHELVVSPAQIALLETTPEESFDGDAGRFRLGIEALRLGLAFEYDPYFLPLHRPGGPPPAPVGAV